MPINVSSAIGADTGTLITIDQPEASQWIDGKWVESEKYSFSAYAVVHSPSPNDLKNLPEGEWAEELLVFVSNKPIHSVSDFDSKEPATIHFQGKKFKVISKADWTIYGFNSVVAVRFE